MTIACSICASSQGPFLQEPTGVPTSPFFYKCQNCSNENKFITFDGTIGFGASETSIQKYFYKCSGCGNLYYHPIPYAYLRYDVKTCPGCGTLFPSEEQIEFPETGQNYKVVLMGSPNNLPQDELPSLYENLLLRLPLLSKSIDEVMLVETKNGGDIWVVCQGNDPQTQKSLQWILMKAVDRKITFSRSQRYDFAIKEDGLTILKRSK